MTMLPAITVWQPWASLIAIGFKPYEFRGWAAPRAYRGRRIAIHAGARPVRKAELADLIMRLRGPEPWLTCLKPEALPFLERAYSNPASLPLSAIVATAVLGDPRRDAELIQEFGSPCLDSTREEHRNWAWPLTDIQEMQPPVPAKGAQGFWEWRA